MAEASSFLADFSVTEKCFEKAKQKQEYSKITYLTLMIGTLEVMIEDLEKKSIHA